jgi:hypothetical protein
MMGSVRLHCIPLLFLFLTTDRGKICKVYKYIREEVAGWMKNCITFQVDIRKVLLQLCSRCSRGKMFIVGATRLPPHFSKGAQ